MRNPITTGLRQLTLVLSLVACAQPGPPTSARPPQREHEPGYPPGLWRLHPSWQQLDSVVLWSSVIWLRHAEVRSSDAPFGPPHWQPWGPAPQRTRAAALALAHALATEAQADPTQFARLAATYSDDLTTRAVAGSLGGMRASQLPAFALDALSALRPGQVSKVIEQPAGFLILQRRGLPDDGWVAGKHVVVGYAGAPWLEAAESHAETTKRSRAEALARAHEVVQLARSGQAFDTLVARYSDHLDVVRGGDLGRYSTRDPGLLPRQVEALSRLALHEVSEPLDTPAGFEVLLRTESSARARYAAALLAFPFDATSRARSAHLAEQVARELRAQPALFAGFQRQYGDQGIQLWERGREPAGLMPELERLAIGEISRHPVLAGSSYYLVQRVDAAKRTPSAAPSYELSHDPDPDLDYFVRQASGPGVVRYIRFFAEAGRDQLQLDPTHEREFIAVHDALIEALEAASEPRARSRVLNDALAKLEAVLGNQAFNTYLSFIRGQLAHEFLAQPASG